MVLFARKYLVKVTASLIFSVSSFISLIFVTRYVGEAYGMMMWGMAFVILINTSLDVGFHSANIKKVSEGNDINKCVSTYLFIRIAISTVTVFAVLLSSLIMNCLNSGFPAEFWMVAGVFVLYCMLDNITLVMTGTFIGNMDAGKESAVLATEYLVRAAALIAFAVTGASAVVLSFGYVFGAVAALIISFLLFRSLRVRLVRPAFFKEYASFVTPFALPLMFIIIVAYIDKVMIGAYHGELEVGFYTAAAGIVYSFIILGTVMNGLLLSHMSKLNAKGSTEEARNTLWAAQKYLAVLMFPATVFLLIFGNETAVALFKEGFAASGPVLSVLALNIYFAILAGMFSQVLLSAGRTVRYGRSALVYAAVTVLLLFILIPGRYPDVPAGAVGAAAAIVTGMFIFVILLAWMAKRSGTAGIYPRIYVHAAAGAVVLAMLYCLKMWLGPSGIPALVLLSLLSVAVYAGLMVAVRELTKDDVRFVRDTLSPKGIYDDLRGGTKKN
ncbi:MAG: oligosaccharide flippase family protein [Methanomassiliicoccaceae archaeon]|jgi:O-antigen/teichoic acid export membrane protein|nr:oligosaccharide flippase family protein [Methanomassiliicoccaceae archaeon]